MLSLAHNTRIYVYRPAADLRKSFDGLTGLVRSAFAADPRDGSWFLFFNKRRDRLKILAWEPDGFSIWYKPLTLLLSGVSLATAQRRKRFAAPA
jgi:transposase